jgi:hypothetical protein
VIREEKGLEKKRGQKCSGQRNVGAGIVGSDPKSPFPAPSDRQPVRLCGYPPAVDRKIGRRIDLRFSAVFDAVLGGRRLN